MFQKNHHTLINPQTGNLAFKLYAFNQDNPFDHIQQQNYYSLIWLFKGKGKLKSDFSEYDFDENTLFCFSPHQPFMLNNSEELSGMVMHFHPDFFCIHKHQKEVACNGVLFNNIYNPPMVAVDEKTGDNFKMIIEQVKVELEQPALAQYESLIAYLKLFLIAASRLKTEQYPDILNEKTEKGEPFILQNLKQYIEANYRTKHAPSDYADLLAISTKALSKLTKTHFNKTLTDLISERIVIEAKRELYLTNKTVKEIAFDLGYTDEFYFSRFFKKNAEVSPQLYRETVGFNRAEMV